MDRVLLWLVLLAPLAVQLFRYGDESIFYGEFLGWSGEQSARLLLVTLAVSPLRAWLPSFAALRWLARRRRDLGIATFVYASAHAASYLQYKADWARIWKEAAEPGLWTGWIALVVFAVLAVTSNDASLRTLGRSWARLHRSVHLAAVLTFAHWILTAFDPTAGAIHAGVLALLLLARIIPTAWRPRANREKTADSPT